MGLPGKPGQQGNTGVTGLPGSQGSFGPKVRMMHGQFVLFTLHFSCLSSLCKVLILLTKKLMLSYGTSFSFL